MKKCCLCGTVIKGWGNDPWPLVVDEKSECCDDCNYSKVLPARILGIKEANNNEEKN